MLPHGLVTRRAGDRRQHCCNVKRSTSSKNKASYFISMIFRCLGFCPSYRGNIKLSKLSKNSNLLFFTGLPVDVISSTESPRSWESLPGAPEALPGSKDSAASRSSMSLPSSSKDCWKRSQIFCCFGSFIKENKKVRKQAPAPTLPVPLGLGQRHGGGGCWFYGVRCRRTARADQGGRTA